MVPSASSYRFSNAVVDGRLLHDVSITTGNGFIASVSDKAQFELDLTDYTAVPSFIDVHTHGMLGVDTASLNKNLMAEWLTALPKTGTLNIVPTLVSSCTIESRSRTLRLSFDNSSFTASSFERMRTVHESSSICFGPCRNSLVGYASVIMEQDSFHFSAPSRAPG